MAENIDHLGQQFGEYRLLRWLGGGGFGEVYLGEHVRDQTLAAVKVLHTRLTEPGELKAFINEARTIRLKHPNIVPLLDFGIGTNDIPFLVMEYAPHGTLRTLHPKGSQLSLSTIMAYVHPIASALQYAHNLHLVHRDVKPENMLIGADSQILLSDFGIATVALNTSSSQGQESMHGTIPYMAPEQFEGKSHPACDQYALAVVIYEWLSGVRPFQGTTTEVAMQHRMANPPSLREMIPSLPHEVEQVVMIALAKDPRQRFASVGIFATALGEVGQTGRISALSAATAATKMLTADEGATRTMPTDVVLEPQPVDAATPDKMEPSGSDVPVVVAQTPPSVPPKSVGSSVLSKRKKVVVAGLALTLLLIASLFVHALVSQPVVQHPFATTQKSPAGGGNTVLVGINLTGKMLTPTTVPTAAATQTRPSPVSVGQPTTASRPAATSVTPTPTSRSATTSSFPTPTPTSQPATMPKPTPVPQTTVQPTTPSSLGTGSIRINSGGSAVGLFAADEDFSNITPNHGSYTTTVSSVIDTSSVSNPAPQGVYQSYRVGDCLYTIAHLTPNASYTVRLHFAETYWTQPGQRLFNVTLNGNIVLSNFDVLATAGAANKAVVEQFVAHADSTGTITIQFNTVKDNAEINAIEVLAA